MAKEIIIGIDLGTTNSVVSYLQADGKWKVIPNPEGKNTTASVVAFKSNGEEVVGDGAKRQSVTNPDTVSSIKRKMGTTEKVHISCLNKDFTPQEISAKVLSYMKKYAEENKLLDKLEKAKIELNGDDFREGLTAIVSIKVAEPQFEGQTKTKLGNNEVMGSVDMAVSEALGNFLEENPKEAKLIVEKVVLAATARKAAQNARKLVQRASPLSGFGLPGKLFDCSSKDPSECELFLVEGDSAGGTAKQGRDRVTQAILPLRGKILNVEKAMTHKVFDSQEIKNIYTALGVTIGTADDSKALNLEKLRYHKVIIMTDADVDGSHIATLILTFFFRYMKELIEGGHVYIATPPLYLCKKGKVEEYCWNEQQRLAFIEKYGNNGTESGIHVQRYKGLGEMNAAQLKETTMDKQNRTLRQVTIENAMSADRIFSMLMGDDVAPRREFIEKNATYARIDA